MLQPRFLWMQIRMQRSISTRKERSLFRATFRPTSAARSLPSAIPRTSNWLSPVLGVYTPLSRSTWEDTATSAGHPCPVRILRLGCAGPSVHAQIGPSLKRRSAMTTTVQRRHQGGWNDSMDADDVGTGRI